MPPVMKPIDDFELNPGEAGCDHGCPVIPLFNLAGTTQVAATGLTSTSLRLRMPSSILEFRDEKEEECDDTLTFSANICLSLPHGVSDDIAASFSYRGRRASDGPEWSIMAAVSPDDGDWRPPGGLLVRVGSGRSARVW